MTEIDFLDRQQGLAVGRLERAMLGGRDLETAVAALERATARRPWLAVGTAAAAGALAGAVLGRVSCRSLIGLARLSGQPVWRALRRISR